MTSTSSASRPFTKACILVLDGAGIGALPDVADFGDPPTVNTLSNLAHAVGPLNLPNFQRLGLGNLADMPGVPPADQPGAFLVRMAELSNGKDTPTGHWEMVGVRTTQPFATYADGFPPEIIEEFQRLSGYEILGNLVSSGTVILDQLGPEHMRTGKPIVYTSADSVFQIAAHEGVMPIDELHRICQIAREMLDKYRAGRVIARPFIGRPGSFKRTYNRKDFSMPPPKGTLLDQLVQAGIPVLGVGKIQDIFAGCGIPESIHTEGNTDGIAHTLEAVRDRRGLIFTNLVDFDALYGHRRDPQGFYRAMVEADAALPALLDALGDDGLLVMTADHGNDPTYMGSTDHTREYVPLILASRRFDRTGGADLGTTDSFAALGQTLAQNFGVAPLPIGQSFFREITAG
jgi:phosphopentomutase